MDQSDTDLEARSRSARERDFIETNLALFRANPAAAQAAMIQLLKDALAGSQPVQMAEAVRER